MYLQQLTAVEGWGKAYPFIYNSDASRWEYAPEEQSLFLALHSVEVRAQGFYPLGLCSDFYGKGFGGKGKVNFSPMNPSTRITSLQYYATLSYQRLSSKTSWVSSFNGIGVSIGISVPFSITDTLAVLLELEGGANVYLVYGDVEGCGEQDLTPFIDPVIGSATTLLIGAEDGFQFTISPGLFWLFEKGAIGQIATLDIGLRANL